MFSTVHASILNFSFAKIIKYEIGPKIASGITNDINRMSYVTHIAHRIYITEIAQNEV